MAKLVQVNTLGHVVTQGGRVLFGNVGDPCCCDGGVCYERWVAHPDCADPDYDYVVEFDGWTCEPAGSHNANWSGGPCSWHKYVERVDNCVGGCSRLTPGAAPASPATGQPRCTRSACCNTPGDNGCICAPNCATRTAWLNASISWDFRPPPCQGGCVGSPCLTYSGSLQALWDNGYRYGTPVGGVYPCQAQWQGDPWCGCPQTLRIVDVSGLRACDLTFYYGDLPLNMRDCGLGTYAVTPTIGCPGGGQGQANYSYTLTVPAAGDCEYDAECGWCISNTATGEFPPP